MAGFFGLVSLAVLQAAQQAGVVVGVRHARQHLDDVLTGVQGSNTTETKFDVSCHFNHLTPREGLAHGVLTYGHYVAIIKYGADVERFWMCCCSPESGCFIHNVDEITWGRGGCPFDGYSEAGHNSGTKCEITETHLAERRSVLTKAYKVADPRYSGKSAADWATECASPASEAPADGGI